MEANATAMEMGESIDEAKGQPEPGSRLVTSRAYDAPRVSQVIATAKTLRWRQVTMGLVERGRLD